ncbi:MAG TPA: ABC transporter permease, partial [Vicinamibacteria bacterium]
MVLTPFLDHVLGAGVRRSLWVIQSASLLFLAIGSINVSALLLARSLAGDSRTALQVALGASRKRLAGRALLESCFLYSLALVAGASIFWLLLEGLKLVAADTPRIDEIAMRPSVLWFSAAIASIGALAVALPGAAHAMKLSTAAGLRLSKSGGSRRTTLENALIVTQIGMASLLLIVAFLVTKGYRTLTALDLGYTPEESFTFKVTLFDSKFPTLESKRAFIRELIRRLEELPDVEAAGAIHNRPLEFGPVGMDAGFWVEGQTAEESRRNPAFNWQSATPGFLRAAGIDLIEGRSFSWLDDERAPLVVIVSEGMARRYWPGESAIGKRLVTLGARLDNSGQYVRQTVVGVVEDARYRELETPRLDVYVPMLQAPHEASNVFIRSEASAEAILNAARAEAQAIDEDVPVSDMAVMSQVVEGAFRERRLTAMLVGVFGAVGVLLATLGVFGTVGYLVVRRAREIGLRFAVGAEARNIVVWVLARGLTPAFAGLGLGVG